MQPSVGLFFSDRPPTRVSLSIKLESKAIDIPAGHADYAIDDRYVLPADVEVLSVYPHAHYLAKEMKGTATLPDGTVKPLIWIRFGFPMAGPIPLRRAAVSAEGNDARHASPTTTRR